MLVSFSTLACPKWRWEKILDQARQFGYDGIEIRGIEGEMDLSRLKPFFPEHIEKTLENLRERQLKISCLDTSCSFAEVEKFVRSIEEGQIAIDLAQKLDCRFIRVFADSAPIVNMDDALLDRIASGLDILGSYAIGKDVSVLIETHGAFSTGDMMARLLEHVKRPEVGVLWDITNGYIDYGEPIAVTCRKLGSLIRHTHIKDAQGTYPHAGLCLFGQGVMSAAEIIGLLASIGYTGWLSLEWEKMWHPELEEPEIALDGYIRHMRIAL